MKFGEKVKMHRNELKLSQEALAKMVGVTKRSIAAYEAGTSYPRYKEVYDSLAESLHVTTDYLRTENEEFMEEVGQLYGNRGQQQASHILNLAGKMFAGGELSDDDQIAFLTEIQQLYLDSKKRAKKFTPKKYRKDQE